MSLLSLPTEILHQILLYLPSRLSPPPDPNSADSESDSTNRPLIDLDPNLLSLCATDHVLRAVYPPSRSTSSESLAMARALTLIQCHSQRNARV